MTHQDTGSSSSTTRSIRGNGSIFQTTKNGTRQFCSQISYREDGKRRYIRGYGPTPAAAVQARQRATLRRFSDDYQAPARGITLSKALDQWLTPHGQKLSEQSRRKYRRDIENHIIAHIGDKKINALTSEQLTTLFHQTLPNAKAGPSAIHHTYTNLNTLLNYCVKNGLLETNPLTRIEKPSAKTLVEKNDKKFINRRANQYLRLLKKLDDPTHPCHEQRIIFLLLTLGLRRSELLGLEWTNILNLTRKDKAVLIVDQQLKRHETHEAQTGYYLDRTTKTGKERKIYLPETYRKALLDHKKHQTTHGRTGTGEWSKLVLTKNNKNLTYRDLQELWTATWRDYFGPKYDEYYFRIHYVRHIAGSIILEATGGNIQVVQEILGHSQALMSLHYSHTMEDTRKKGTKALETAITK